MKKPQQSTTALQLVLQERLEQFTKHGHTLKQDVHNNYLHNLACWLLLPGQRIFPIQVKTEFKRKMINADYKKRLTVAIALLMANLDRQLTFDNRGSVVIPKEDPALTEYLDKQPKLIVAELEQAIASIAMVEVAEEAITSPPAMWDGYTIWAAMKLSDKLSTNTVDDLREACERVANHFNTAGIKRTAPAEWGDNAIGFQVIRGIFKDCNVPAFYPDIVQVLRRENTNPPEALRSIPTSAELHKIQMALLDWLRITMHPTDTFMRELKAIVLNYCKGYPANLGAFENMLCDSINSVICEGMAYSYTGKNIALAVNEAVVKWSDNAVMPSLSQQAISALIELLDPNPEALELITTTVAEVAKNASLFSSDADFRIFSALRPAVGKFGKLLSDTHSQAGLRNMVYRAIKVIKVPPAAVLRKNSDLATSLFEVLCEKLCPNEDGYKAIVNAVDTMPMLGSEQAVLHLCRELSNHELFNGISRVGWDLQVQVASAVDEAGKIYDTQLKNTKDTPDKVNESSLVASSIPYEVAESDKLAHVLQVALKPDTTIAYKHIKSAVIECAEKGLLDKPSLSMELSDKIGVVRAELNGGEFIKQSDLFDAITETVEVFRGRNKPEPKNINVKVEYTDKPAPLTFEQWCAENLSDDEQYKMQRGTYKLAPRVHETYAKYLRDCKAADKLITEFMEEAKQSLSAESVTLIGGIMDFAIKSLLDGGTGKAPEVFTDKLPNFKHTPPPPPLIPNCGVGVSPLSDHEVISLRSTLAGVVNMQTFKPPVVQLVDHNYTIVKLLWAYWNMHEVKEPQMALNEAHDKFRGWLKRRGFIIDYVAE